MLSRIEIQNYRSFLDVKVNLAPFNLVIGANGSGKSNFLSLLDNCFNPKLVRHLSPVRTSVRKELQKHFNYFEQIQSVIFFNSNNEEIRLGNGVITGNRKNFFGAKLYNLELSSIENAEEIEEKIEIAPNGQGIINVIDRLKTGDREDLFNEIETSLIHHIPFIEKLSLCVSGSGKKYLQVREKGIKEPFPAKELSEGTKLILMILTILHQENPPKLILLEDIDRGLHPRLFQKVVEMLRDIVKTKEVQIIATTHNPYLVDEFTGEEESVLIVEKEGTVSTITSLADRLQGGDTPEEALGSLWFSGFFGGVPKS